MNIPDRWIALLDMLNDKDLATLMRAILHGEEKPTLTGKNQSVADLIYGDIEKAKRNNGYQRKYRSKSDNSLTEILHSSYSKTNVRQPLDVCKTDNNLTVRQEERKESLFRNSSFITHHS